MEDTRQIEDIPLKTLYVKNIAENISRDDIIDLFGLHKTEAMKKTSRVGIMHGNEGRTAIVEVFEDCYDDVLKLNGVHFKGQDLNLTTTLNEITDEPATVAPEHIEYLEVDTRLPQWNFRQVTAMEIAEALEADFEDDPTKSVEEIGRYQKSLQGIFRIDSANYDIYLNKTINIRGENLPFKPIHPQRADRGDRENQSYRPRRREGRREGTLITIYRAYRMEYRQVSNEAFDDYFNGINVEVIKPTQAQVRKGTSVLNNNRYLVVQKLDDEPELRKKIGASIVVNNTKFNVVYDGMVKYCWLCSRNHDNHCPSRNKFDFLSKLRHGRTSKRKI